jgi:uncharacterized membrane protein (DUF373 family)
MRAPLYRFIGVFEVIIIAALQLLLVVVITVATAHLFTLLFSRLPASWSEVTTAEELHVVLQRAFGGVLIVVLGLELLETLKVYFKEHRVRLEVILIVSLIAVGRHIIQVDYAHLSGMQLVGIGSLVLALAGGYFLVARSHERGLPRE